MTTFDYSICRAANASLRALIFVLAWLPVLAGAQNTVIEVIPLNYRTAEQVIPALKPLLDKNGTLSSMQNQLIVRTTPGNLAELKRVLATLDAVPRRLVITVRQDAMLERERTRTDVSGRVSAGDAAVAVAGAGGARGGTAEIRNGNDVVRGRIDNTRSLDADRDTQSLQVLEGNSAFIRTGQSIPVPQSQFAGAIINGQFVGRANNAVEYRDVLTGFYVLPRVAGDRVTLEINPQRDTLARPEQNLPRGSVNVQQAATIVSGRLGEWIEVGAVVQGVTGEQSRVLGSTRENSSDNRRILLKVEEIR
jgi:hypothetical protein